jgi:hypothetical protein
MAACPNCGRQTLRTKDWACQWCGYPLISNAFKKIDKTYKELQEERSLSSMMLNTDVDTGSDVETETAPEPETKPQREKKPGFSLFGKPKPRPEPKPQPAPRQELPRELERRPPQKAQPERPVDRPAPVYRPEPRPEPAPRQVLPAQKQEPLRPEPIVTPPPVTRAEIPPAPPVFQTPEPVAPPSRPEIVIEYQAPYVSSVKLEDIKDGMEISAEDLDALFKADKTGINSKLTGKTIILKGVVEKVFIREHLDIRYIMVTGKKKLTWSSRCTFEKENAVKATRLSESADVAVRAKYDGYGKNIIFKDCDVL